MPSHTHTHTHTHTYTHTHTHTHVCKPITLTFRTCTQNTKAVGHTYIIKTSMHNSANMYTYTPTHKRAHIYTHKHTCTFFQAAPLKDAAKEMKAAK